MAEDIDTKAQWKYKVLNTKTERPRKYNGNTREGEINCLMLSRKTSHMKQERLQIWVKLYGGDRKDM